VTVRRVMAVHLALLSGIMAIICLHCAHYHTRYRRHARWTWMRNEFDYDQADVAAPVGFEPRLNNRTTA